MLGPLERQVIAGVKRLGAATTREVLRELRTAGVDVAYTTVATILSRLHRKGLVGRRREPFKGADRFVYSYMDIESVYIDDLLGSLITAFGKRGVAHLAERLEAVSEEDLRRIRARLEV